MGFLISFGIAFLVSFFVVSLLLRRGRGPTLSWPVLGYGLCYLLLGAVLFLAVTR